MEGDAKGFTLIELLVVISIVMLFSGIILAGLIGVRNQGKDARIKSSMDQIRKGASVYQSYQGNYTGLGCGVTSPVNMQALCNDVNSQSGSSPVFNAGTNDYCAYTVMASSATKWFCVSSVRGEAVETATNPDTTCAGASYDCP